MSPVVTEQRFVFRLKMPLPESPPTGQIPFEPPAVSSPDLTEFWILWRAERFWACHEALEEAWRREPDAARKLFLNGLIHGAVCVFQFRRGNAVGAARQWTRARAKLQLSFPTRDGVDLQTFLNGIEREIEPALTQLSQKQRADLEMLRERLAREIQL